MRKLFLIVRSNMCKAKGQTVAIIVLFLIASILLNLWLMLSMDYTANFDRYHDKLNAEHVTVAINDNDGSVGEFLSKTLNGDSQVKEYRLDNCMHMVGSLPYNGGEMNSGFVFMDKQTAISRTIGKAEIVEDSNISSGVYLPMLYRSNECDIGKQIDITIGSNTVKYTICGFFNSIMMGSHNCSITQIILTEDKYLELEKLGYAEQAVLCSVRLNDKLESLNFEAKLKSTISEHYTNKIMISNSYNLVLQSRYISQMICSGIMSAMAFIVLLISLVIVVSNIVNYIQVNMKNLGTLKAVGYTSIGLIGSLLVQFVGVTVITAVIGSALSYVVFPAVNAMMISQTGIPYAVHFLPLATIASLLVLCGAVALSVWLSARRINKIEPIVALRSGIVTHNFKKNHIPLDKTKAPINVALALKTTLSGVKNNITVCVTMFVLSLVIVFSGLMTENMIVDTKPFLDLVVGETADSCINVNVEAEEPFLEKLSKDSRVEKFYLYNTINVSHKGGAELTSNLCNDFSKTNNQSVVFEGEFPKHYNEIALAAKYAKENGYKLGDEIEITINGNTQKYLISGFTQTSNNLGRDCLLTREGYERLGELQNASYYINLVDGVDIGAFNEEYKNSLQGNINATINIVTTIDGAAGVYVSLMTIIVIAILAISAIIIAFVLYLLVRTMLTNKTHDYGILKSLGFTTKQLVFQTALSFMPAVIISTIVGAILSSVVINPLTALFLSGIGVVKCTFRIPVTFTIIVSLGLILLSFALACLMSLKIKKITPHKLLIGE